MEEEIDDRTGSVACSQEIHENVTFEKPIELAGNVSRDEDKKTEVLLESPQEAIENIPEEDIQDSEAEIGVEKDIGLESSSSISTSCGGNKLSGTQEDTIAMSDELVCKDEADIESDTVQTKNEEAEQSGPAALETETSAEGIVDSLTDTKSREKIDTEMADQDVIIISDQQSRDEDVSEGSVLEKKGQELLNETPAGVKPEGTDCNVVETVEETKVQDSDDTVLQKEIISSEPALEGETGSSEDSHLLDPTPEATIQERGLGAELPSTSEGAQELQVKSQTSEVLEPEISQSIVLVERAENKVETGVQIESSLLVSPSKRYRLPDHDYQKGGDSSPEATSSVDLREPSVTKGEVVKQDALASETELELMDVDQEPKIEMPAENFQEDSLVDQAETVSQFSNVSYPNLLHTIAAPEGIPEEIFDRTENETNDIPEQLTEPKTEVAIAATEESTHGTAMPNYGNYGSQVVTADGQVLTVISSGQDESVEAIQAFIQGSNEWSFDQQMIQITNPPVLTSEGIALEATGQVAPCQEFYVTSDMLQGASDHAVSLFEVRMPDGSTQYLQIPVSVPVMQSNAPTNPQEPPMSRPAIQQRPPQKRTQIQRPRPVPAPRQYEEGGASLSQLVTSSMEAVDFGSEAGGTYILSHAQHVLNQCVEEKPKPLQIQEDPRVGERDDDSEQLPVLSRQKKQTLEERVSRLLKGKPGSEPPVLKSEVDFPEEKKQESGPSTSNSILGYIPRSESRQSSHESETASPAAASPVPTPRTDERKTPVNMQPLRILKSVPKPHTVILPKSLVNTLFAESQRATVEVNRAPRTKIIDGKVIHNFGCEPIDFKALSNKKIDINPSLEAFSLKDGRKRKSGTRISHVEDDEEIDDEREMPPRRLEHAGPSSFRRVEEFDAPPVLTKQTTPRVISTYVYTTDNMRPKQTLMSRVSPGQKVVGLTTQKTDITKIVDGQVIYNIGCDPTDPRQVSHKKIDLPPCLENFTRDSLPKQSPKSASILPIKRRATYTPRMTPKTLPHCQKIVKQRPPPGCIDVYDETPLDEVQMKLPFDHSDEKEVEINLYESASATAIPLIRQLLKSGRPSVKLEPKPRDIVTSNTVLTPYGVKTEKKYIYTDNTGKRYEIPAGNNMMRFNNKPEKPKKRFQQFEIKHQPKEEPEYEPPEVIDELYTEHSGAVIDEGLVLPYTHPEANEESSQGEQYYYSEDGSVVVNPPAVQAEGYLGEDGYYYYASDGYFFTPETLGMVGEGGEGSQEADGDQQMVAQEQHATGFEDEYPYHTEQPPGVDRSVIDCRDTPQSDILDLDAVQKASPTEEEDDEEFVIVHTCPKPAQTYGRKDEPLCKPVQTVPTSPMNLLKSKKTSSGANRTGLKPIPVRIEEPRKVFTSLTTRPRASLKPSPDKRISVPFNKTPVRVALPQPVVTPRPVSVSQASGPVARLIPKQLPVLLTTPSKQAITTGPTRVVEKQVAAVLDKSAPTPSADMKPVKIRIVPANLPPVSSPSANVVQASQIRTPTNGKAITAADTTPKNIKVLSPPSASSTVAKSIAINQLKNTFQLSPSGANQPGKLVSITELLPVSQPPTIEKVASSEKPVAAEPKPLGSIAVTPKKQIISTAVPSETSQIPVVKDSHVENLPCNLSEPALIVPEDVSSVVAEKDVEDPLDTEGPPSLSPVQDPTNQQRSEQLESSVILAEEINDSVVDAALPTLIKEDEIETPPPESDDALPPVLVPIRREVNPAVQPILADWDEWDSEDEKPLKPKKPVLTKTYDRRKVGALAESTSPERPVQVIVMVPKDVDRSAVRKPEKDASSQAPRVESEPKPLARVTPSRSEVKPQQKTALRSPVNLDASVPIVSVSPGPKQVRFAPSPAKSIKTVPAEPVVPTPRKPIPVLVKKSNVDKTPTKTELTPTELPKKELRKVDKTPTKTESTPVELPKKEAKKRASTPADTGSAKKAKKTTPESRSRTKENGDKTPNSDQRKREVISPESPSKVKEFDIFSTPTMKRTSASLSKRVSFSETTEEVVVKSPEETKKAAKSKDNSKSILKRKTVAKKNEASGSEQPERKRRKKPIRPKTEEEEEDDFLSGEDMGEAADRLPGVSSKPCPVCSARYTTAEGLANHIATHNGLINNKKVCPLCTYSVLESKRSKAQIQSHILTSHRILLPDADVVSSKSGRSTE